MDEAQLEATKSRYAKNMAQPMSFQQRVGYVDDEETGDRVDNYWFYNWFGCVCLADDTLARGIATTTAVLCFILCHCCILGLFGSMFVIGVTNVDNCPAEDLPVWLVVGGVLGAVTMYDEVQYFEWGLTQGGIFVGPKEPFNRTILRIIRHLIFVAWFIFGAAITYACGNSCDGLTQGNATTTTTTRTSSATTNATSTPTTSPQMQAGTGCDSVVYQLSYYSSTIILSIVAFCCVIVIPAILAMCKKNRDDAVLQDIINGTASYRHPSGGTACKGKAHSFMLEQLRSDAGSVPSSSAAAAESRAWYIANRDCGGIVPHGESCCSTCGSFLVFSGRAAPEPTAAEVNEALDVARMVMGGC